MGSFICILLLLHWRWLACPERAVASDEEGRVRGGRIQLSEGISEVVELRLHQRLIAGGDLRQNVPREERQYKGKD